MTHKKGTKLDPPLLLDMSFDEALGRFVLTKREEVDESIERAKTKRPPQDVSRDGQGASAPVQAAWSVGGA